MSQFNSCAIATALRNTASTIALLIEFAPFFICRLSISSLVTKPTARPFEFFEAGWAAYTISIESAGFKRYVREGVRLNANDCVTVKAALKVGGVNDQVTVNAEVSALEIATASTGEALD